jgi:diguanylate cyclase (GGDEF)-like protein
VGFPTAGEFGALLTGALIRKTGSGSAPVPQALSAAQLLDGDYDGELVQLNGVVSDRAVRANRLVLSLQSGHIQFTAQLQSGSVSRMPEPGARVRVAGICSLQVDDSREAIAPRSFEIRMRSPADLSIVTQPPWLTFERLLPIFLMTLAVAAVALTWAARLRRRLNAQTNNLVRKTAQLEKEHRHTTTALCRAREAEVMEHAHNHVLELVARDEDPEGVIMRLAYAVEEHCLGASCSIQLRMPGGQRLGASPSLAPDWQDALVNIEIEDFCGTGMHSLGELSQARAWNVIGQTEAQGRIQRLYLTPIEWEARVIGVVIAFLGGELVLRRSEQNFLVSASKLAALAVERHLLYDQLSYQAQHDELTGLENRAMILVRLFAEIRASAAAGTLLGVIYIDLDNFKGINDTFGHAAGDAVLREVARRMTEGVRGSDAVARLGGDEFVVVLPGLAAAADAFQIAKQLVDSVSCPVAFCGHALKTGASAGVSLYPADGEDAETLLKAADARMYREKSGQRHSGARVHVA